MTTASLAFLGFALAVACAYNLARSIWWRQGVLLLANAGFLAGFAIGPVSLAPLLGFLAAGYGAIRLAQATRSRGAGAVLLLLLVAMFFWLKRYSFLPQDSFLGFPYTVIGISYIFFRVLHLVIDASSGDLPERLPLIGYLNYTLNFTSLVSGPIQRYQDYAAMQLRPDRLPLDWIVAGDAFERIVTGLFKVVVLAAILHGVHERALATFAGEPTLSGHVSAALAITVGYTFYLYCNFSGYTDIVIGAARFYRLELPENFNRPLTATSFIDFWARWHMTLSGWLKTYVYNPLLIRLMARFPSPRVAPFLAVVAFFVTFFLIGVWHGQTSVFVAYGVLLGFGVSVNKLDQVAMVEHLGRKAYRALTERHAYRMLARGLTFTYFTFSLMFFWGSWPVLGSIALGLGIAGALLAAVALILLAGVLLSLAAALRDVGVAWRVLGTQVLLSRYTRTVWVTTMGAVAVAALTLLASPAPDVGYKTF